LDAEQSMCLVRSLREERVKLGLRLVQISCRIFLGQIMTILHIRFGTNLKYRSTVLFSSTRVCIIEGTHHQIGFGVNLKNKKYHWKSFFAMRE
jgi:hypothetical protein